MPRFSACGGSPGSVAVQVTAVVVTASGPAPIFAPKQLTSYDFTAFGSKGEAEVHIYRTDQKDNMHCIQKFRVPAPVKFAIIVPPVSMTTVVMKIEQQYRPRKAA